jgi:hypothetical protein
LHQVPFGKHGRHLPHRAQHDASPIDRPSQSHFTIVARQRSRTPSPPWSVFAGELSPTSAFLRNWEAFWEEHNRFHAALLDGCQLKRLLVIQNTLERQHSRYYRRLPFAPEWAADFIQNHEKLVAVALSGDADAAAAMTRSHAMLTSDTLLKTGLSALGPASKEEAESEASDALDALSDRAALPFISAGARLRVNPQQNGRHERMHRALKQATTKPPGSNMLQQQDKFESFVQEYNFERPHEALAMKAPGSLCQTSRRPVTQCGRICMSRQKVSMSTVLAQLVGVRQHDQVWKVSFMDYDLGYFDLDSCRVEPGDNPFGPRVLTM